MREDESRARLRTAKRGRVERGSRMGSRMPVEHFEERTVSAWSRWEIQIAKHSNLQSLYNQLVVVI